ncbi:MAG: aminotransferase [Alphaproteobacteria bacterium]|jgi:4-aminobutyrate--pyruvate transaminase|nr:aminotransferase [Alphaproteobacteria bacterium]|tara:strand:+ start:2562 stop:3965 length:1404 start_codon:yes stop_codon:yes gene_type:complete
MSSTANSAGARAVENILHGYSNLAALEKTPPVVVTGGRGVRIIDEDGKEYIEGAAGMWCASFGFNEPELIEAAIRQFKKLPYYHSLIDKTTEPLGELAERLKALAPVPMSKVFFANSGSEANDTAVKMIYYYNNARGRPEKKKIIARQFGFHGVTMAAASMTGIPSMHAGFDLPLPNFRHTEFPHYYRFGRDGESEEEFATRLAESLEAMILEEGPDSVAAFVAEPVMGGGGCVPPPKTYFEKMQAVLNKYDVFMIADEIITGFGRTGNMFGSDTFNIKPDIMTMAKGLSGAYQPISAIMITDEIYSVIRDESNRIGFFGHAFTTTGHPVAVAVANRAQQLMQERDIVGHVRRVSPALQNGLRAFSDHPLVGNVRGVGLMAALELVAEKETKRSFDPAFKVKEFIRQRAQDHGLIIRSALSGDSVAFSPPLIITEDEIGEMMQRFAAALDDTTRWIEENGLRDKKPD